MYKLLSILLFAYCLAVTTDEIYDKSWALIIGINKYDNVSNLDYAVKDANAIASLLKDNFNFPSINIKILLNEEATFINIRNSLAEIRYHAKENDRVLLFFAGHGETEDLPDGGEMGYLLPVDGKQENLYASAIPMNDLKDLSVMSKAKHMLFLVDACYGGLAAIGTRSLDANKTFNYIEKVSNIKSRQIITAGGSDEKVIEKAEWGHSAFTMNLLRGLKDGNADLNTDGYITANELGMFLSEKVTKDSENQQTPQTRRLTSHEGEFIFFENKNISNLPVNDKNNNGNVKEVRSIEVTGLSAQGGLKEVMLQWDYNSNAISYNIYRDREYVGSSDHTTLNFLDGRQGGWGLGYNTSHCYILTGISESGNEGPNSNQVCATTVPQLQAFLDLDLSLANADSASVSSPFGDLTGDGNVDGVIMVKMVNLFAVNGYQFNFSLNPGIVDVISAVDGTTLLYGDADGLDAQIIEIGNSGTIIGFDSNQKGSISAGYPLNPTGKEDNLLALLVLSPEYMGSSTEVSVTISDFIISGVNPFTGVSIVLDVCDTDQVWLNGCFDTDTFSTPKADCAGVPNGNSVLDTCGICDDNPSNDCKP